MKICDTSESTKKSIDEVINEVLENKFGKGADINARLADAGYGYAVDESNLIHNPEDMPVEIALMAYGTPCSGTLFQD